MKKIIMTFLTACFALVGQAQSNIKFSKSIKVGSETSVKYEQVNLKSPPTNSDFAITDDEFVNGLLKAFSYWDMDDYKSYQSTLYTFPKNNSTDSMATFEGENNLYVFHRVNNKWEPKTFTIKGTNVSLRHVACGQTSKEVFKLLKKKSKVTVGDGQIWISDKDNKHHFVFTFAKDKLVSMQL
jgi:hypothetical protein